LFAGAAGGDALCAGAAGCCALCAWGAGGCDICRLYAGGRGSCAPCAVDDGGDVCHGHEYQHAANKEIAGICRRICTILELKKEEEITRVCAGNNTLGIIKVRARGHHVNRSMWRL